MNRFEANQCHFGDCRDIMRGLISQGVKVQMCVTSPPYWGLRDYGIEGQLGMEKTIEEYVGNMVEVFGLARDLLEDDGTLWLNLGDSYAGSWGAMSHDLDGKAKRTGTTERPPQSFIKSKRLARKSFRRDKAEIIPGRWGGGNNSDPNLKPKDLCGIPWRVAFALQSQGWYLRSDIIWAKPNPMPESVTDRPTKSHEYLFLLTKNERYYYDQEAISEPSIHSGRIVKATGPESKNGTAGYGSDTKKGFTTNDVLVKENRNKRSVWTVLTHAYPEAHFATFPPKLIEPCILAGSRPGDIVFDPFLGSGTTAMVAQNLGRKWIGIELNKDYEKLQKNRVAQLGMEFSS